MKKTINRSEFISEFRSIRPDNFSLKGLCALWDYFEDFEEDTGEELDLYVIAICCEFTEYENLKEFQDNYGSEYASIEDIEERTFVIRIDETAFIIKDF